MSLDPSLVPGYELESYDVGTLFDEIEAAGLLPDVPVVVIRRGDPAKFSDDPLPGADRSPWPRSMRSQHRAVGGPGAMGGRRARRRGHHRPRHHPLRPEPTPRRRRRGDLQGDRPHLNWCARPIRLANRFSRRREWHCNTPPIVYDDVAPHRDEPSPSTSGG